MKEAKLTPLSIEQYIEISENIYDEIERIDHDGIIVAKCVKHPEYGDIILISSPQGGCLMIHF
jgi:Uma2 family endonuclease